MSRVLLVEVPTKQSPADAACHQRDRSADHGMGDHGAANAANNSANRAIAAAASMAMALMNVVTTRPSSSWGKSRHG
jgi:hypothetical protein